MKKTISAFLVTTILLTTSLAADTHTFFAEDNISAQMQKIEKQMDQIFNQMHQKFIGDTKLVGFDDITFKSPAVDVVDKKDHYLVKVDIPGVESKSIKVTQKDGILEIEANTVKEKKEKSEKYIKQERFVGRFVKMMTLPNDADASKLKTKYKNGVLEIIIPKRK